MRPDGDTRQFLGSMTMRKRNFRRCGSLDESASTFAPVIRRIVPARATFLAAVSRNSLCQRGSNHRTVSLSLQQATAVLRVKHAVDPTASGTLETGAEVADIELEALRCYLRGHAFPERAHASNFATGASVSRLLPMSAAGCVADGRSLGVRAQQKSKQRGSRVTGCENIGYADGGTHVV
jgi:hypothetical protein